MPATNAAKIQRPKEQTIWSETDGSRGSLLFLYFLLTALVWSINQTHVETNRAIGSSEWSVSIPVQMFRDTFNDETISGAYVPFLPSYADRLGLWLATTFGTDAATLDKWRLLIVTLVVMGSLFAIGRTLELPTGAIVLGAVLVFSSLFTHLGRYLTLGVTLAPTHSAVGFAGGLAAISVIFRERYRLAGFLLGLLANYHPTHALVITLLLGVVLLARRTRIGLRVQVETVMLEAIAALPLVVLLVANSDTVPIAGARATDLWWSLIAARTTNVLPLADGPVILLLNGSAMMVGWYAMRRWDEGGSSGPRQRTTLRLVWGWFIGLWLVAVAFSHLWPVAELARIGLTRVMPYAMVLTALGVAALLWERREQVPLTTGALVLALVLFPWAPLKGLAEYFAMPVIALLSLLLCQGLKQCKGWRALCAVAVALALVVPAISVGVRWGAFARLVGVVAQPPLWAEYLVTGTLLLALVAWRADARVTDRGDHRWLIGPRVTIAALCVLALGSLGLRAVYVVLQERGERDAWIAVQQWAREATQSDSMFVVDPASAGFQTYSERAVFVDWLEMMLPLYVPALTERVVTRIRLLGVDVRDSASYYAPSLLQSVLGRAQKRAFVRALRDAYPSKAISALGCIRREAPRVRYLVARHTQMNGWERELPIAYENEIYRVVRVDDLRVAASC